MEVPSRLWLISILVLASPQHTQATCDTAELYRSWDSNLQQEQVLNDGQIILTPIDPTSNFKATYRVTSGNLATFTRVTYRVLDTAADSVQTSVVQSDGTVTGHFNNKEITLGQNITVEFSPHVVGYKIRFVARPFAGTTAIRLQIFSIDRCLGDTTVTTTTAAPTATTTAETNTATCDTAELYRSWDSNLQQVQMLNDGQIILTPTDPTSNFKATYLVTSDNLATFTRVTYRVLDTAADSVLTSVVQLDGTVTGHFNNKEITLGQNITVEFSPPAVGYKIRFVARPFAGTMAIRLQIVSIEGCLGDTTATTTTPSPTTTTAAGQHMSLDTWLSNAPNRKPNVLFLISDDLRPWLGSYGEEFMVTPNLDQLAKQSVRFDSAYCQQAVCGPSRTSFMTGRRSVTTRVMDLIAYWREEGGNFTTVSQYFKENGYWAEGIGKIYHSGTSSGYTNDYPYSWSAKADRGIGTLGIDGNKASVVHPVDEIGGVLSDTSIADIAVDRLNSYGQSSSSLPFFLGVGFKKPHLPFMFPRRYGGLYVNATIPLAQHRDLNMSISDLIWGHPGEMLKYDDIKALNVNENNWRIPDYKQDEARRGYASAVSYVDDQVGRVLQALTDNGFAQNTIIIFFSDHGFQLGEVGEWCKHSNYDIAVRVPLLVRVPGVTDNNEVFSHIDLFNDPPPPPASSQSTPRPVELVDVFPTLTELAGLSVPQKCPLNSANIQTCVEGASLVPVIREVLGGPAPVWKDVAFSVYPRRMASKNSILGYTLRTRQYRYTEWVGFDFITFQPNFNYVEAKEFYRHDVNLDGNDEDFEEANNEVYNPQYSQIVAELSQKLRDGWYAALQNYSKPQNQITL